MSKNFLLVSLNDKKARKLASAIKNPSCRKILDFLATKEDVTETQISKETKIPLSTVHYSMKQLIETKLVKSDEYHYSSKGKEVNHYKLANKYVIIAPEEHKKDIREKLKTIIPVVAIVGAVGLVFSFFTNSIGRIGSSIQASDMSESAKAFGAEPMAMQMENAPVMANTAIQTVANSGVPGWHYFGFFVLSAIFGVSVYLFVKWIRNRK
ncbi:helix-turn-helix transcriptional regulator [Candidatus Woesearchaeota archaeon]|jgi:DNA-binding transcriptional ArsR family regulator|nr:helix-turn-helix transcriptional regulator [Candidatus Woesearchaeota archaeon]MBT6520226.1 helix-turn-helix transcriptional regulator [Candidatus Woesearchaeota archaeon]MBT7367237.1 helix-turn-helix transcriptional regulator [Candidatus Woesearchaeota archaeon]